MTTRASSTRLLASFTHAHSARDGCNLRSARDGSPHIVVVGGGLTGLSCALRLQTLSSEDGSACRVTVLEASSATGGKLQTERVGEFIVDTGPDIFLANKTHGIALCSALGIIEQMQPTNPENRTTYVRRGNTLHAETLYADLPLITPRAGMQTLVDAARAGLVASSVHTGAQVRSVTQSSDGYQVTLHDGTTYDADAVVIALPAPSAATVLAELSPDVSALLAQVPYTAMTTVSAAWKDSDVPHPLDGYGYIVADAPYGSVTACTWTSAKISGRAPTGYTLLRGYVRGNDAARAESLVLEEIRTGLGVTAAPLFVKTQHWTEAVPLYDEVHTSRVLEIHERLDALPAIAIAGGALDGAGIPDSIASATAAADAVWNAIMHSDQYTT